MTEIATDVGETETFRAGTVITRALRICGRRFPAFFVLAVIASIPSYVSDLVLPRLDVPGAVPDWAGGVAGMAAAVLWVADFVADVLASGIMTYGVFQELRGRRFSVLESVRVVPGRLLPLVGIALCMGLGTVLGLMLLVVPGVMLMYRWYVAAPVCIAEGRGVFESMTRSRDLTAGHRWRISGLVIVEFLVRWIIKVVLTPIALQFGTVALMISTPAMQAAASALAAVLTGVAYYELRTAREGVDIEGIASVFD